MDKFDVKAWKNNALDLAGEAKERAEELFSRARIAAYIEEKKEDDRMKKTVLTVLSVIGAIAAIAAIAYAVYRFMTPDYLEDFEDYEDLEDEDVLPED